jgi:hypothetical protein
MRVHMSSVDNNLYLTNPVEGIGLSSLYFREASASLNEQGQEAANGRVRNLFCTFVKTVGTPLLGVAAGAGLYAVKSVDLSGATLVAIAVPTIYHGYIAVVRNYCARLEQQALEAHDRVGIVDVLLEMQDERAALVMNLPQPPDEENVLVIEV